MAINALVEQMSEEQGVGFIDLSGYSVGKGDIYMKGSHYAEKGAAVFFENLLRSMDSGPGATI